MIGNGGQGMDEIEIPTKTCNSCGQTHEHVTKYRVLRDGDALDGIYFECQCGSTMFVPWSMIEELFLGVLYKKAS